jgi:hypothetical protein
LPRIKAAPARRITRISGYELGDGGQQLIVHTEVSGGRGGTRRLRTVYEREPGVSG